jgi:sigma-B regulation protein RsbU (phosphoserine phosphatase)
MHWVALASVPASGWVVTAAVSESEYLDPIIQRLWHRALLLGSGMIVLLLVATLVSIRISRPIERMATAVNQLAAGDLDAQVSGVHGRDELAQLAGAFNTMTRQLKSHVAALTEQTAARESVEAELRIARQIQNDLLPRTFPPFPDRAEFALHALNVPAKRVAGDFFDFFFAPADLLTIVIADVSGKGVPAALLMAVTRTIVRNLALEGMPPGQIAERTNAMLLQDTSDSMFVTMFLCQYDTRSGRLMYINAGHPMPFRYSAGARAPRHFGEVTGPLLGVQPTCPSWLFEQREEHLDIGEALLLYTDGVTEARAPDGTMLRDAGTQEIVARLQSETVEGICTKLVNEVNRYQANQLADDITVVALQRRS